MPVYTPPANNALDAVLVVYTPAANNALDADFTGYVALGTTPIDVSITVPDATWSGLAKVLTVSPIDVSITLSDATIVTIVDLVITPDPIDVTIAVPDATMSIAPVIALGTTAIDVTVSLATATMAIEPVVELGVTPIDVTISVPDALFLKDLLIIPDPIDVSVSVPDATFDRLANLASCFLVYESGYVHRVIAAPTKQLDLEGIFPQGLWTLAVSYVDQYGNESPQASIQVEFDADGHVLSQLREVDTIASEPLAGGYVFLSITLEDRQTWHRNPTAFQVYDTATQQVIGTITATGNGAYITEATVGPFTHGLTKRLRVRPYDASRYGVWSDVPSVVVDSVGPMAPVVVG